MCYVHKEDKLKNWKQKSTFKKEKDQGTLSLKTIIFKGAHAFDISCAFHAPIH